MEAVARIEACLETAIEIATASPCPPKLAKAVHYSVFPGGARVRPLLCVSVAAACSCQDEEVAEGAAAAIELLHCASLVHDDLPCFDDADMRRGRKSVHASLFVGAVTSGAIAAGSDPSLWRPLGEQIGEAYQIADDLLDAVGTVQESGKPVAQDENFSRPNAVSRYGLKGAMSRLKNIVHDAADSIPECKGGDELRELIIAQATRLVPAKLAKDAA